MFDLKLDDGRRVNYQVVQIRYLFSLRIFVGGILDKSFLRLKSTLKIRVLLENKKIRLIALSTVHT